MKRLLSLILVVICVAALMNVGFATGDKAVLAADELYELGLFQGKGTNPDGSPNYALQDAPTRHEAITMLVRLLGKESEAKAGKWDIPFTDVASWAKPYVGYAYANGLTHGTSASTFGGDDTISASQYITFVLRALGYEDGKDFSWNAAWELSDKLGITAGQYGAVGSDPFLREDVVLISYDALDAKVQPEGIVLRDKIIANQTSANDGNKYVAYIDPIEISFEFSWRVNPELKNSTKSTLTLNRLRITHNQDDEANVLDEVIFEKDRLAGIDLGKGGQPLTLKPGETYTWHDGHPVVDYFNCMTYEFQFLDEAGNAVEYTYVYHLNQELPELVYPSYANDNGYDINTLRYNANYCVEVHDGVYWVNASSLGKSDYTNAQIQALLTDTPEEKQAKIDTLYEALQLYQVGCFLSADDNIRIPEGNIRWEHHKPGYHAVRTNRGCCATDSNWLRYILDGDYDEVGYIAYSERNGGGHIFNYILMDGWYYVIDLTHYRVDFLATAVESGRMEDYYRSDIVLGNIHKVQNIEDYVSYVQDAFNNPPGLMFMYTAENCLALDGVRAGDFITITYEDVEGVSVQVIFDDLTDQLNYTFVFSPRVYPDWSREEGFDFSLIQ